MSLLRSLFVRIHSMICRHSHYRLEEELRSHAQLLADDYLRRGLTETEAHYAARRELGNLTAMQEQYREQNSFPLIENFWRDLKYAFRTLRRSPAFAISAAGMLAVGIASVVTVICVVAALLWKPLPYPNPNSLLVLKEVDPRSGSWSFSEPALLDVQQRAHLFDSLTAFRRGGAALTGAGSEPEPVQYAAVTPSFFGMLGVAPIRGTLPQDALPHVVISRKLWSRRWQSRMQALGSAITIDSQNYTISGIADIPRDLLPGVELLVPLVPKETESRTAHEIEALARLRPGVSNNEAQAELNAIAAAIASEHPATNAGWSMRILPLSDYVLNPNTGRTVWMIFAAVALLWLLACANVAGLQLARTIARRHEMETRLALGASRNRLMAQTLTEVLVLAFVGSVAGILVAHWTIELVRNLAASALPRLAYLQMDASTVAIAISSMLAFPLFFGLFSGRAFSPRGAGTREVSRRDRGRDVLIVAQVTLASVLLLGAVLLLQSFLRLRAVDPGFRPDNVLSVRVNLSARALQENSASRIAFFRSAIEQIRRLPQVQSAAATNVVPLSGYGTANRFRVEGESATAATDFHSAAWRAVTPGFFTTVGVPLKRGRLFTEADTDGAPEVVILSESMARRFWPREDPLGQHLLWGKSGSPKTIVGIVGDLRDLAVDAPAVPTMFRPFDQLSDAPMSLLVRTKQPDYASAVSDIRRIIWQLDRNAALEFQPLSQALSDSLLRPRASFLLMSAFALIATVTAAFGLYGLISYRVMQRQQEIGIRLALGASTYSLHWNIQKRCLLLVCLGASVGLPIAFALAKLMAALLYETHSTDASAYAAVFLTFVSVALAASFGPARRAARMDPASALRRE